MIQFYDSSKIPRKLKNQYLSNVSRVLEFESFIDGLSCKIFEEQFSKYLGVNFCVGVGNGYDALVVALRALDIGPGSKVAVPSHTFIATWLAVQAVGAEAIGIDVDEFGQMDLQILEGISNLDCVIVVHMHGYSCDLDKLLNISRTKKFKIIEDCAQAAGLVFNDRKIGSFGDISTFSFYPTKNLFALGDGGAVCTNDSYLNKKMRSISRYGQIDGNKYKHSKNGINSRLDTIQAICLSTNLLYLDEWNFLRQGIAEEYNKGLRNEIQTLKFERTSVYHHFIIFSKNRNQLRRELESEGISTEIHYPILAASEMQDFDDEFFPEGRRFSDTGLSIPINPWQTKLETKFIINVINRISRKV